MKTKRTGLRKCPSALPGLHGQGIITEGKFENAIDEANAKKLWRCMTMTGQMKKYRDSLEKTPEPILLSQMQTKMDLRGLMNYAKEKGKKVMELSEEERMSFVKQ